MDLDSLLAHSAEVEGPTPAATARALTQLEAAAANERPTRRNRVRRYGLVAAAAVLVAAGAALWPSLAGTHGSTAEASTVLRQAAEGAGNQPGGWPDAAYWHSLATYEQNGKTITREIWISHYGTSVLSDPGVEPGIIDLGPAVFPVGGSQLTWDQLSSLPTDPDKLATVLRSDIHGAGQDDDSELYVIVGDLLRESPAPPALRRALYQMAASIPGVTFSGEMTDRDGRDGKTVTRDGRSYLIDPTTGQLLQEGGTVYTSQGPISSAPAATVR